MRDFDEGQAHHLPGWVYELRDRVAILERRTEYLMAQENDTQAQADQLAAILTALTTDWNTKATEIATLENTVKTLQSQQAAGTPVDLSGLLTQATALRTSMEASEAAAAATQATGATTAGETSGAGAGPAVVGTPQATGGTTAGETSGGAAGPSGGAAETPGATSGSTGGGTAATPTSGDAVPPAPAAAPADGSQTADVTA